MRIKTLFAAIPIFILGACGGEESDENESSENTNLEEAYHTSFGSCEISSSAISLNTVGPEGENFATEPIAGLDLNTFSTASAELVQSHKTLYIKYVNNVSIIDANTPDYGPSDISLTILLKADEELEAGEYSDGDIKIKLTKATREGGTSKTKDIGSNKTSQNVTINDISEDHVCGSYSLTGEDGTTLVTAQFDLDVKVVKF